MADAAEWSLDARTILTIWCQDSNYDYYDEILEFRPDTEDWSLAGRMIKARSEHSVSTINFEDVRAWCN